MNVNWLSLVHCEETDSTNNQVKNFDSDKEMTVLTTQYQKAGRGQRGNSWESEKSQNLLFSILIHPNYVTASHQFCSSHNTRKPCGSTPMMWAMKVPFSSL